MPKFGLTVQSKPIAYETNRCGHKHRHLCVLLGWFSALTSDVLLGGLSVVLQRSKFTSALVKIKKSAEDVLDDCRSNTELVTPAEIPPDVVRDPKDQAVLVCAVGGQANYIVCGDKDVLVLDTYESIPIITAAQFLEVPQ